MPIWLLTIGTRLLGLRSVIAKAWGWITGSSTHLLLAALIASNAAWFIGHRIEAHSLGKVRGQLARWPSIYAQEQAAFKREKDSLQTVLFALSSQNKAVQALGDAGRAKQLAAEVALRGAVARSRHGAVSAERIDQEALQRPSGAPCKSGAAVMAARGDL